jgi:hypothetical protein
MALTVLVGTLLSIGNTTWHSGVQRKVLDELLGRYLVTDEAGSFAMMPAGTAIRGFLVLRFGIFWTDAIAGVGSLIETFPWFSPPPFEAGDARGTPPELRPP